MEQPTTPGANLSVATLDSIRAEIDKTQGWLRFLAMVSFIMVPISIFLAAIAVIFNPYTGALQLVSNIISGAISIVLAIFLFQASSRGRAYADAGQPADLLVYHGKLMIYFIISGVLIIIVLAVLVIGIIFGVAFGLFSQLF